MEKKNFIWNVIGLSFNSFISLILLILVKRINGIETAGIFTYAFSLSCLFFIISSFYNRTFQVSEYKREYSFGDYFTSRIIFVVISFILGIIFCFINGFEKYKVFVILLLLIYKSIEAICDSIFGQIQIEGNLYKTGISYTLKSILGMVVFLIIDLYTKNLLLAITGLFTSSILILFIYDIPSLKEKFPKLKLKKDTFIKLLGITAPIFIYTFLQNYLSNSQKMLMTYFIDNKLQTIFGILIMPATMLIIVGNYIVMPFLNTLTSKYKEKKYNEFDNVVSKMCICLFLIGIICVLLAYFLGVPVLNFIYNIDLKAYKIMLVIIIIGSIFNAITMVLSNILTIMTINKRQTVIYFIMSIIATIITTVMAHFYGISGLCYSYIITFTILFIVYYAFYKIQIKKLEKKI
ncbi:MAG: hypothetical protein IKE73_00960 [Bacilli bacterium]|nr:hypothetical protein [Bacilli bacterium]